MYIIQFAHNESLVSLPEQHSYARYQCNIYTMLDTFDFSTIEPTLWPEKRARHDGANPQKTPSRHTRTKTRGSNSASRNRSRDQSGKSDIVLDNVETLGSYFINRTYVVEVRDASENERQKLIEELIKFDKDHKVPTDSTNRARFDLLCSNLRRKKIKTSRTFGLEGGADKIYEGSFDILLYRADEYEDLAIVKESIENADIGQRNKTPKISNRKSYDIGIFDCETKKYPESV